MGTLHTIKDWSTDEQPRERMQRHGPATLADSELIAILLRTGIRNASAMEIAKRLLRTHGGLTRLASSDLATISQESGVGLAKGASLIAAFELGRRAQVKAFNSGDQVRSPKDIADRYVPIMRDLPHEEFWVIHLNKANIIIRHTTISKGGVSASVVDAHEVFREAILDRAASVILLHNHPSGNPEPSREDIALTRALADAGAVLQLPVYDHLIVAGSNYTSLKERRLM